MLNSIGRIHESRKQEVEVDAPSLTITFRHTWGIYTSYSYNFSLRGSECPGSHKEVNYTVHIVRVSLNVKLQLPPCHFRLLVPIELWTHKKLAFWQESLALMIMRR